MLLYLLLCALVGVIFGRRQHLVDWSWPVPVVNESLKSRNEMVAIDQTNNCFPTQFDCPRQRRITVANTLTFDTNAFAPVL